MKIIASNSRANYDFLISQKIEAGLVLTGAEVKSLRFNTGSIRSSFIIEKKGDPTWRKEHKYFFNSNKISNYNNDLEIKKYIDNIF